MSFLRWHETNRQELGELLPEALVVIPVGATEQHGPHLATGTDWLVAQGVAERAAAVAAAGTARAIVVTPPVAFGASDHHLAFGGTLSLTVETMQAVLIDLARSVAASGARRLVLVNGHGGNTGVCHAAAAAASLRYGISIATLDYWRLLPAGETPVPGHAGEFETAMILALHPDFVAARDERPDPPAASSIDGVDLHSTEIWTGLDGYTDQPTRATEEQGREWLEQIVIGLSNRLLALAEAL